MSQDKKKALLNEQTTKRFWKLAGLKPIHETAYVFEEEEIEESEDLEEMRASKEDKEGRKKKMEEDTDDLEEMRGMRGSKEDKEGRKKKMEEDVEDLEERGMAFADEDEPGMDMDDAPGEDQEVEVDVPEGDVDSLRTARDILDQILSAVEGGGETELDLDESSLEEIAERIATRITKRIAEAKKNK